MEKAERIKNGQKTQNNRRALAVRSGQSIVLDSEKALVVRLLYENGDKYVGEFVDGKFTSKGTFTCSNGKQFTGNMENKVPLEFTIRCN